jgi:hypothetical protein
MPDKPRRDDAPEEEWFDEDPPEVGDDEPVDTIRCPECHADIYEDAEQCPRCGHFILPDTNCWSGRPGWWIVLGLIGVAALVYSLVLLGP